MCIVYRNGNVLVSSIGMYFCQYRDVLCYRYGDVYFDRFVEMCLVFGIKIFCQYRDVMCYRYSTEEFPIGGGTKTGKAMNKMLKLFTQANGHRSDVPAIGVLITDGKSKDDVKSVAAEVKAKGITVSVLIFIT